MTPMFRSSADLFAELNRMQALLDQVFPTARSSIRSAAGAAFPVLNVGTTPTAIEVQALAPGLDPAKLEITIDRGLLVLAGHRASALPPADERASVYAQERFAGPFRRVVSLPGRRSDEGRRELPRRRAAHQHRQARVVAAAPHRGELKEEPAMTTAVQNASSSSSAAVRTPADGSQQQPSVIPPVDVYENDNAITLLADLPGVAREQLHVRVDGESLVIEATASTSGPRDLELVYGEAQCPSFRRQFILSRELDAARIEAQLRDGVLRLTIPKAEEARPRRIQVQVG